MELKIWVEGIQRIVCGVSEQTTCQDVVFALAHATGKTGRFTLIEKWRNNERLLAPNESPLKILTKLGEYSSEVQFILQKSEKQPSQNANKQDIKSPDQENLPNISDMRKNSMEKHLENVGIVKGIQQKPTEMKSAVVSINPDNNLGKVEIMKDRRAIFGQFNSENSNLSNENLLDLYQQRLNNSNYSNSSSSPVTSPVGISGSLKPPAYRPPPAPKIATTQNQKLADFSSVFSTNNENLMQNVQYRDLVQLIKFQRDKISTQQIDLTKFDAEILVYEKKGREQIQHLEAISQELSKTDQIFRQGNEQLQNLLFVEEESESLQQQEKSLKSEMALLRSKLSILETELLQCRNKIKKLMDEIQIEQRNQNLHQENRQQLESRLLGEVDRLQADIDHAMYVSDSTAKSADGLKKEVMIIERDIIDKKKQLEKLVHEMKEVNLQSLTVCTSEEVLVGDGSKTGRRIIGSPRQLENAVATSKNPHGVWV